MLALHAVTLRSLGNALSLQVTDESDDTGVFSGHRWAEPSVEHLGQLMLHVVR